MYNTIHRYTADSKATMLLLLLHPIRQALESIVPPYYKRIIDASSQLIPPESSSPLPPLSMLAMLEQLIMSFLRRIMPMQALTLLYDEYTPREVVSLLIHSIKRGIVESSSYIKDLKSSAELQFYMAILVVIVLFLIVLPICEALLFGNNSTNTDEQQQQLEDDIKSYYHHVETNSLHKRHHLFDEQAYYWDDDNDEVELNDLALILSHSSSNSSFSRGGSVGSSSGNSHGSTMETIEESCGEEDDGSDDNDDNEEEADHEILFKGSSTSSFTDSCPDLNETTDDYDEEEFNNNNNNDNEFNNSTINGSNDDSFISSPMRKKLSRKLLSSNKIFKIASSTNLGSPTNIRLNSKNLSTLFNFATLRSGNKVA